jgi:uncharacterized membrane protein required for colicin V production
MIEEIFHLSVVIAAITIGMKFVKQKLNTTLFGPWPQKISNSRVVSFLTLCVSVLLFVVIGHFIASGLKYLYLMV